MLPATAFNSILLAGIAAPSVTAWALPRPLHLHDLFSSRPQQAGPLAKEEADDNKTMPVITETYKSWANATCYADLYGNDRQLPNTTDPPLNSASMTVKTCLDYYESLGFVFAGVEYGYDCYCGNARPHWYWIGNRENCDYSCGGNSAQSCGGVQHLLVYEKASQAK